MYQQRNILREELALSGGNERTELRQCVAGHS